MSWDDHGRKFDAVFCSHVVEHVPDLGLFFQRLRTLIRDEGYLVVVVPRYEGLSCDEHWHIGWNCSQLALTLVASGFDCSEGIFAELSENVCGWGQKRQFAPTHFYIAESAPYLPVGMRSAIFSAESGNLHVPDIVFADADELQRRKISFNANIQDFKERDCVTIAFGQNSERKDAVFSFETPIDISNATIVIIAIQEGGSTILRVAVDSSESGDFNAASEYFLDQKTGFSGARVHRHDFHGTNEPTRFSSIRRLVVGGTGRNAIVKCWVYVDTVALTRPAPEFEILAEKKDDTEQTRQLLAKTDASLIYFLRNRANRLQRQLERLNDESAQAIVANGTPGQIHDVLQAALKQVHELTQSATNPKSLDSDIFDLLNAALCCVRQQQREVVPAVISMSEVQDLFKAALGRVRELEFFTRDSDYGQGKSKASWPAKPTSQLHPQSSQLCRGDSESEIQVILNAALIRIMELQKLQSEIGS